MEDWCVIETFADRVSAEALAVFLQGEGVPALVRARGVVGILETSFEVLVEPALEHRARWLRSSTQLSDAELEALATGEAEGEDEPGSG